MTWQIPDNWYWQVQDSSPATTRFQSSSGTFVPLANADYVAFLAAGYLPTSIDTIANLNKLLNQAALRLMPSEDGFYSNNKFTTGVNVTLSNPMSIVTEINTTAAGVHIVLPPMNQPNSIPIGVPFVISNTGSNDFLLYLNDGTSLFATVETGMVFWFQLENNSSVNGTLDSIGCHAITVLPPVHGGTGSSAPTAHAVLLGEGLSPIGFATVGTAGRYLRDNGAGADPGFAAIAASEVGSGAALTKTDDTNVTLTLGGTPTTALLKATSITVGWSGTLGLSRGGVAADLSATGGAGKFLKQASAGAPITVVQPATADISDITSGTWTPTILGSTTAGTQTYSRQSGFYFKIGSYCYVSCRVTLTAKDAATAGNIQVGGLPFTSANVTNDVGALSFGIVTALILDAGFTQFHGRVGINSTVVTLSETGSNVTEQNLVAANLQATTDLQFSGWYHTV